MSWGPKGKHAEHGVGVREFRLAQAGLEGGHHHSEAPSLPQLEPVDPRQAGTEVAGEPLLSPLEILLGPAVDRDVHRAAEELAGAPLDQVGDAGHVGDGQVNLGLDQLPLLDGNEAGALEAGALHLQPGVGRPAVWLWPATQRDVQLVAAAEHLLQKQERNAAGPLEDLMDRHVTLVELNEAVVLLHLVELPGVAVAHAADGSLKEEPQLIIAQPGRIEPGLGHQRGHLHLLGLTGDDVPTAVEDVALFLHGLKIVEQEFPTSLILPERMWAGRSSMSLAR